MPWNPLYNTALLVRNITHNTDVASNYKYMLDPYMGPQSKKWNIIVEHI